MDNILKKAIAAAASMESILPPEEQIELLDKFDEKLSVGCPYKIGDMVTPTLSGRAKGHGQPHRVIQVFTAPQVFLPQHFGQGLTFYDMLITCVLPNDEVCAYLAHSEDYEPWQ